MRGAARLLAACALLLPSKRNNLKKKTTGFVIIVVKILPFSCVDLTSNTKNIFSSMAPVVLAILSFTIKASFKKIAGQESEGVLTPHAPRDESEANR